MSQINTNKIVFLIVLVFFLGLNSSVFSQKNFTLYHLNETSQASYLNPGFKQKNRVYVSLPIGMQSVSLMNSGFKLNDVLQTRSQDDSLNFTPGLAIEKMKKSNYANIEMYNELLGIGFKVKNNFFSLNVSNRFQTRLTYPKDLFKLAFEGNGKDLLGQRASMDGLGLDLMSYMEYGIGYNRTFFDKLTLGVKVKALSGIANIKTVKSQLGIATDENTFDITVDGAMQVNTSNVSQFYSDTNSNYQPANAMFDFKNSGVGFDLGASYQLTDRIQLNSSLLDLGFINWKSNVTNYVSSEVNYTFKGVDLNQALLDSVDIGKNLTDTLTEVFKQEQNTSSYRTALHSKFYLGGKYEINKYFSSSVLMYNEIVASKYTAGFSVSMNAKLRNWLSASVNYSAYGRSYNNIGLGLNLKGGPIQFYVMTDNILGFINPSNAKHLQVSTGLNIVIGPKKDKDKDGIVDKKDNCPELAGDIRFLGCPDRDNDSIIDPNDECPDVAGVRYLKGCPDKDHDSITDLKDECPDVLGLRKFNGCPDKDNDGIKDSEDACPDVAGPVENQGCPDTDKDGVLDYLDNCVKIAGPKENAGCPWPDTDNDGLLDKDDKCPHISGSKENEGCPYVDTDGDGILDKDDECPSVSGVLENKGCPKIEAAAQEILKTAFDDLEFGAGNAVIKEASNNSLNDLAALLIKKTEWKIQISGHTDNVGNDQSNMILSKKRAEAVKTYLVSKGVPTERVATQFFGKTKPVASNDTEEGRQKNRRVEMKIIFE
jgi:outer membrane protein OmpA-like peptidoglycan-associated protein